MHACPKDVLIVAIVMPQWPRDPQRSLIRINEGDAVQVLSGPHRQ
jgi:hypothetical protein